MSNKTEQQQTLGSASLIGFAAVGGALVGFLLQQVVAYHFGASTTTDAFFMASSTSELVTKLLLGGSITAVFLPLFVQRLSQNNRTAAWELAMNIWHITALLFGIACLALAIFAPVFVRFVAPGFSPSATELTISLLRVLLPSFFFLFLVDLAVAMLHSLRQFAIPALLRIIAPGASVLSVVLLNSSMGIYSLAVGVVIGSIIQLSLVWWGLGRQGFKYRFVFAPRHADIRRVLQLLYPFILSVLVTQAAGIVYRILVSDLSTGSLSSLKYAEKITQLSTIIFLNSVTTVIYPLLSEKASHNDVVGMQRTIGAAIRLTTLVTVPLIIGIGVLRKPLIELIYHHGSFDTTAVNLTSTALLFLSLGLCINAISSVFGHAILALQQTRAAVAITITSQAVAIMLFVSLVPAMNHAGLALASSLVPLSSSLLYYLYLSRFIPRLGEVFRHRTFIKIGILAIGLFLVLYALREVLSTVALPSKLAATLQLIVPTLIGSSLFFGGAYLWHISEMREVLGMVQRKFGYQPTLPDESSHVDVGT